MPGGPSVMRHAVLSSLTALCAAACSGSTDAGSPSGAGASGGSTAGGTAGSGGALGSASGGGGTISGGAGGAGASGGSSSGGTTGGSTPNAGGGGGGAGTTGAGGAATVTDGGGATWWKPSPGTSWQWQLSGALDSSFDVAVYDIDLFDNTSVQIAALHGQGRKVVCYFDTAYEPGRPDSSALAPYEGNPVDGWPGQFWLDVRKPAVVTVMLARLDLAAEKGCDAVEADDVDSLTNNPGFPITTADQEGFIRTLASAAHARGLGYALKNDLDEVGALLSDVDFAVNEECFQYGECDGLKPFIAAGKAVFQVEYTDGDLATKGATFCSQANQLNFDSLVKHLDLGPPRYACR